jgi:hypothetical protein
MKRLLCAIAWPLFIVTNVALILGFVYAIANLAELIGAVK